MENNNIKISIIMPAYNRESIIDNSLRSVLSQTLKEIEIIVIDDGSSDNTIEVIEKIKLCDSRIRLIKTKHRGAGAARNRGLKEAKGEYVAFLDSDDCYADKDALEAMYTACIVNKCDVCGGRFYWDRNGKLMDGVYFAAFDKNIDRSGRWVSYREYQYDAGYCCFIFRRKMIENNNIRFPHYAQYEDPVFFARIMEKAEGFWFLPIHLLKVRIWEHETERQYLNIEDILSGIKNNMKVAIRNGYERLYQNLLDRLENDFYSAIIENMSYKVMKQLLDIKKLHDNSLFEGKIEILDEIIEYVRTMNKDRKAVPSRIPIELRNKIDRIGIDGFKNYFEKEEIRNVVIYGAGAYGATFFIIAKKCGLNIVAIMDQKVDSFEGYIVIKPECDIPQCDSIIVTPNYYESIIDTIKDKTDNRVLSFCAIMDDIDLKKVEE